MVWYDFSTFLCTLLSSNLISFFCSILLRTQIQYRSKVLGHFPRYCCGGITVCISGFTSGKPRLASLKTPVSPRFFAVTNTAVKNKTWWCLNSLLFSLFQRLIDFNKRDVACWWFYDVIHFTWLLLWLCFYHDSQTLAFEYFCRSLTVIEERNGNSCHLQQLEENKTDIIELELFRYIPSDVHFTRNANLMRFWTETNFGLYINIPTISFTVGVDFEFQPEFHLL